MPQMAAGCLSENWLLKELGSLHWDTLCNSLGLKSGEIADARGSRLYATFVRIRLELTKPLTAFLEGDELSLSITMLRFGQSTLQSTIEINSNGVGGAATLLSTFSVRATEGANTLTKSEPVGEYRDIPSVLVPPPFLSEYSSIRAQYGKRILDETSRACSSPYRINPFVDSNGANLLYFAAYQSIADFLALRSDECQMHTSVRDIFYFRNSELTDSIHRVALSPAESLLFRASDGTCIAFLSSTKDAA
jgi:probable biosynthetic protein (TIGR04098 family)